MQDNKTAKPALWRKIAPALSWIVFFICLGCLIFTLLPGKKDPYVVGLENASARATIMKLTEAGCATSDTVTIEDRAQIRAVAQLILDGLDGRTTDDYVWPTGGSVYNIGFYENDRFLFSLSLSPYSGGKVFLTLPDHRYVGDNRYTKENLQQYFSTNRAEILYLFAEYVHRSEG